MTTIELALRLLKYDLTRKQLMEINRQINRIGSEAKKANPKMALLGATVGKLGKVGARWFRHLGQTFESAVLRTLSYGLITLTRQIKDEFIQAMKEAQKSMLNLSRAAVIVTRGSANFESAYRELLSTAFDASKAIWLSGEQISNMSLQVAKGGVSLEEMKKYFEELGVAQAITGEKAEQLALNTVRLQTAFGIAKEGLKELVASTIVASTKAVGTIDDILQGSKYLAPIFRTLYGDGMKAAKSFMALAMAGSAAGVKGQQMARWMRRALFQIIAPTNKTRVEFAKYGIEVLENSALAKRYASDLSKVGDKLNQLHNQIDALEIKYNELSRAGLDEEAAKIKDKVKDLNKEIYQQEKIIMSLYNRYLQAGGKIRPIDEIIGQFAKLRKEMAPQEFLNFLNRAFSIRSSQGIATAATQAEKLVEILDELKDPIKAVNNMITEFGNTAPGKVLLAMNAFDKLRRAIGAIGVETLWAPIGEAFRKHIAIPLTEFFAKPEVQEGLKKYGEIIAKDLETIAELMKKPEKGKPIQIELEIAWNKLFADINKIIGPFLRIFFEMGKLLGKALAKGVAEAFIPESIQEIWRGIIQFSKIGQKISRVGLGVASFGLSEIALKRQYEQQFREKPVTTPLTQVFAQELANIRKLVAELPTKAAETTTGKATEKAAGALEGAKKTQEKTTRALEETTIYFVKNGEKIELITSELGEAVEAMKKTGRILEAHEGNLKKVAEMINKLSSTDHVITQYIRNVNGKVEAIKAWIRRQALQSRR